MTPDENGAWIYLPTKPGEDPVQKTIRPTKDDVGDYYLIPRNSLVYVKIKQKLRVPFYIIGRHNLKIRYVYQGLLLGTGPQVDPGFCGNLFIPLHNFTTRDVKLYIDGSFISIDFTRTTELSFGDQSIPNTKEELYSRFEMEKHLIKREKVTDRITLTKYLDGALPRSQMGQFLLDFASLEEKVNGVLGDIKTGKLWMSVERIAVIVGVSAIVFASLNYFRGYVSDLKAESERVKTITAATNIAALENRILLLESNQAKFSIDFSNQMHSLMSNAQAMQTATTLTNGNRQFSSAKAR
jgi:hypothetical protein